MHGRVELQFKTEKKARKHSTNTLKRVGVVLLLTYMGRRISEVRLVEKAPEKYVTWLIDVTVLGLEDKITFFQTSKYEQQN